MHIKDIKINIKGSVKLARTKGTTKKKKSKTIWKFEIGDKCTYVGTLYAEYKDKIVIIDERTKGKTVQYYKIKSEDGVEVGIVLSTTLNKIEEVINSES